MKKRVLFIAALAVVMTSCAQLSKSNKATFEPPVEELLTWQDQAEYAKKQHEDLKLIEVESLGTIDTDDHAEAIIHKMFGDEAYTLLYSPNGKYRVVSVAQKRAALARLDVEYDYQLNRLRRIMKSIFSIGAGVIEMLQFKWEWQGREYLSYGVAGEFANGIIYETMGHYLVIGGCEANTRESSRTEEVISTGEVTLFEILRVNITPRSIFGQAVAQIDFVFENGFSDSKSVTSRASQMVHDNAIGYHLDIDTMTMANDALDFSSYRWSWAASTDYTPDANPDIVDQVMTFRGAAF